MSATVTDVRVKRRPFLISILAILVGIWGLFLIIGGIGLLLFSWWTSFGENYEFWGLTGPLAGIVILIVGLIYIGITLGLWRMRFWAWIIALLVSLSYLVSTGLTLTTSAPAWLGFALSLLITIYLFVVVRAFRGVRVES